MCERSFRARRILRQWGLSAGGHDSCHQAHRGRRWLDGEDEPGFLSESAAREDGLDAVRMSSITYRIATGRDAGRMVVTLQTLPGEADPLHGAAGKLGGQNPRPSALVRAGSPASPVPAPVLDLWKPAKRQSRRACAPD